MHPRPGVIIGGKYKLERRLATGGQGSIWLARHMQLDSEVAIKVMDATMADSPMARARFEREARAAARIRHPNVVHVQDCGIEGGLPYLVMELFKGEDLGKRIRTEKRIPLDASSRILFQISKGLRRLHEEGYIHRDIKPGNIFLTRNEEGDELVKLLDFGIIKDPGALAGENTKTGEFMGSPHYMSPEQVQAAKDIDARSDLWSLGVVLFRMVTGQLPFPGEGIGAVVAQILSGPFPPPSSIVSDLPRAADEFFARALSRPREQRFQTVGEMAEAFGRVAGVRAPMPSVSLLVDDIPSVGPRPAAGSPVGESTGSHDVTTLPRTPRGGPQAVFNPAQNAQLAAHAQHAMPMQPGAPYARRASDPMFGAVPPSSSPRQEPVFTPPSGPTPLSQLTATQPISPEEMMGAIQKMQAARNSSSAQPLSSPQPGPPSSQHQPSSQPRSARPWEGLIPAELDHSPMGPMGTFMIKPATPSSPSAAPVGLRGEETVVGGKLTEGGRANSITWWLVGGLLVGAGLGAVIAIVLFLVR